MNMNKLFKDFYAKVAVEEISDKNILDRDKLLDRGLAMCVLSKCIEDSNFPTGVELSCEKIMEILNIDSKDMDCSRIKNMMVIKFNSDYRVFTLSTCVFPKMTLVCQYNLDFIMNDEYGDSKLLALLAKELGLSIYCNEMTVLEERFAKLSADYITKCRNSFMIKVDEFRDTTISGKFVLKADLKYIYAMQKEYEVPVNSYLNRYYVLNKLDEFIGRYPSTKAIKTQNKALLQSTKDSKMVSDSELFNEENRECINQVIMNTINKRDYILNYLNVGLTECKRCG